MCIWKVRTSPYHAYTNGQVEWAQQTLMHMIGKLSRDQKAEWPKHLPESVHPYYSMRKTITGYNPYYLMFGCWPHLPINLYFPMMRGMEKKGMLTAMLLSYVNDSEMPSRKHKCSPHLRLRDKQHYDRKANVISLETGDLVLAKADTHRGKRKVKDQWEEEPYEVEHQVGEGVPSYLMKNQ